MLSAGAVVGLCLLALELVDTIVAQTITCQTSTGSVCSFQCGGFGTVDFSGMDPDSLDSSNMDNGGHKFSFSPCKGVLKYKQCATAAVCQYQQSDPATFSYNCGQVQGGQLKISGNQATLIYVNGEGGRHSTVFLTCVHDPAQNKLVFLSEQSGTSYTLNLTHTQACALTPDSPSKSSVLSTGSILLIVFGSLMLIYFLGGAIFLRHSRGATGFELIPHVHFWSSLPGLVKDGALFVREKCQAYCHQQRSGYEKL